jgi:N-acetylglutamate synthase-like GNAT family acetyltransferase
MNIRLAALNDHSSISILLHQLGYQINTESLKTNIEDIIANTNTDLYLYDLSGTIVAYMSIAFTTLLTGRSSILRITDLAVNTNYQGLGIGEELLEFSRSLAIESHCNYIEWNCPPSETALHRFALINGFERSTSCFFRKLM